MNALDNATVARVVFDLIDDGIRRHRERGLRAEPSFDQTELGSFSLGPDGADLDSLELLGAAGHVNEFFRLHESGVEDVLLRKRRIGEWAEIVLHGLSEGTSGVTFATSGTTGTPKQVTHSWATLEQEITFLAEVFSTRSRVISTVPAHHIYGFLFTVLLPTHRELPTLSFSWEQLGDLKKHVAPGDLVVSHPTLWRYLSQSVTSRPKGVWGTSSTAPLPADIHTRVRRAGIERLIEIYGSTETGGVGMRERPEDPFELFPYLSPEADSRLERRNPDGTSEQLELQDRIEWVDGRRFFPRGRIDRVVQIGGENVNLDHVESVLGEIPGVESARVSLKDVDGEPRLAATVVASPGRSPAPTEEAVQAFARERLRSAERPVSVTIGSEAQGNEEGGALSGGDVAGEGEADGGDGVRR